MSNALAQTHSQHSQRAATQDSTSTGTQARYNRCDSDLWPWKLF